MRAQRQHARPRAGPPPADRRQHHARARSRRGAPVEPALVGRFASGCISRGGSRARRRTRSTWSGARGEPRNGCRTRRRRPRRRPTGDGIRPRRRLLGDAGRRHLHLRSGAPAASMVVTRTIGAESSPRWARNGTHVTYVRDGNLFIVPVQAASGGARHAAHRRRAEKARTAPHRQPEVPARRGREADWLHPRAAAGQAEGRGESKADKLPAFELQDRQTAADLMLSPDDTHVFILVAERPAGAKSTIVPNYVTESGYTEDIPGAHERRRHAGSAPARGAQPQDRQERVGRRQLRAAGRRTREAGAAGGRQAPARRPRPGRRADREIRWSMPVVSADGRQVVAAARSADNKDRWIVDARSGDREDARHRRAAGRGVGARGGSGGGEHAGVPSRQPAHLVPLRARRLDAPVYARRRGRGRQGRGS